MSDRNLIEAVLAILGLAFLLSLLLNAIWARYTLEQIKDRMTPLDPEKEIGWGNYKLNSSIAVILAFALLAGGTAFLLVMILTKP